jgi:hypothetical protein
VKQGGGAFPRLAVGPRPARSSLASWRDRLLCDPRGELHERPARARGRRELQREAGKCPYLHVAWFFPWSMRTRSRGLLLGRVGITFAPRSEAGLK